MVYISLRDTKGFPTYAKAQCGMETSQVFKTCEVSTFANKYNRILRILAVYFVALFSADSDNYQLITKHDKHR